MQQTIATGCINRLAAAAGLEFGGDVAVVLIVDTEGAEKAAGGGSVGVDSVGAGGPGGLGGSTEVRAVVPGGGSEGAGEGGIVGDGGSGPHGGEGSGELREVGDVGELRKQKHTQVEAWSARVHCKGGSSLCICAKIGDTSSDQGTSSPSSC